MLHPHAAEHYRQTVALIHDALKRGDQASREAVAIVRGMIEAIEIKPGPDKVELTVVGDLASFLRREQDGNLSTTLMVAGTCYHQRGMAEGMRSATDLTGLPTLVAAAFLFGIVHAFMPGHGKTVLVSYHLSRPSRLVEGVATGTLLAITHVGLAVVLVLQASP